MRHEHVHAAGLRQVHVSLRVEPAHDVVRLALRAQHDYRNPLSARPRAADNLQPADVRQDDVDYRKVVPPGLQAPEPALAVASHVAGVPHPGQGAPHHTGLGVVVFDYQRSHGPLLYQIAQRLSQRGQSGKIPNPREDQHAEKREENAEGDLGRNDVAGGPFRHLECICRL